MDLADSPQEATFRATARAWLGWALPQLPRPEPADLVAKAPFWRQWQRLLFDAGYAGLSWPQEYGRRSRRQAARRLRRGDRPGRSG